MSGETKKHCQCPRNMPYFDWSHDPGCELYYPLAEPSPVAPGEAQRECKHQETKMHCVSEVNGAGVHREYWLECTKCGETFSEEEPVDGRPPCKHEKVSQGTIADEGYMVVCDECGEDLSPARPSVAPGEYERPEPQGQIPEPRRLVLLSEEPADEVLVPCPLGAYVEYADYCVVQAALTSCREERDLLQRRGDMFSNLLNERDGELATETKIVDRVWKALGVSTYAEAKGKSIDELVTAVREERDRVQAALRDLQKLAQDSLDFTDCEGNCVSDTCPHNRLLAALKPVSDRQPEGETRQ